MQKKIYFFTLFFLFFYFLSLNVNAQKKLLIFDTSNQEPYFFDSFVKISESVGFDEVNYKSIAEIADSSEEELNLEQYDAVLFFFSVEFLETLPVFMIKKALRLLKENLEKTDKITQEKKK